MNEPDGTSDDSGSIVRSVDDDLEALVARERTAAERHRRNVLRTMGVAFVVLLGIIVAVQWGTDTPDNADELPEFALTTIDGEPFELRTIVGTPAVLNFFATWCPPCRDELPAFQAVSEEVGGSVAFFGINTRETDVAQVAVLLDETGVTYPVLLGDDGTLYADLGALAMPSTVFVDADGTIVEVHSGILNEDTLSEKLTQHFGVEASSS